MYSKGNRVVNSRFETLKLDFEILLSPPKDCDEFVNA